MKSALTLTRATSFSIGKFSSHPKLHSFADSVIRKRNITIAPIPPEVEEALDPSKNLTVVIIGGRSQLGETTRRRFLAAGWNVVCTTQGRANRKFDERDFHLIGDVNLSEKSAWTTGYWNHLFQDITTKHGVIHTIVNCAGVAINNPKSNISMEDINTRPVKPMLEAAFEMKIPRYTFVSSQAAAFEEVRHPGSYSLSKYQAEEDIKTIVRDSGEKNTEVTIIRPDIIISADNPGHFGSPQTMSTLPVKITVGYDARNAGQTTLFPVSSFDVADAIVNISEHNVKTPEIINATGPEAITISALLDMFRKLQKKKFLVEFKLPTDAVSHVAGILPKGSFEPDHINLIKYYEQNAISKTGNNDDFKQLVALSRPGTNDEPLLTLSEIFDFTKRPAFGRAEIGQYCQELSENLTPQDALPLLKAITAGVLHSRIDFYPNRKHKSPEDGVDSKNALLYLLGALAAIGLAQELKKKEEKNRGIVGSNTEKLIAERSDSTKGNGRT